MAAQPDFTPPSTDAGDGLAGLPLPGTALDVAAHADSCLAMIEPMIGPLRIVLGVSVFYTALSPILGNARGTALGALQQQEMLAGLAHGIVLTAQRRPPVWIKQHGFVKMWPVRKHPGHGRQLQGIYNTALMAGIAHARRLDQAAARNLIASLLGRMDEPARRQHGSSAAWKPRQWEAHHRACADILQQEISCRVAADPAGTAPARRPSDCLAAA
ncbi:hypothetical protein FHP25_20095 [Vineibacter terrae]|uniref:Uncharacterized protein n=1 Tax=Vineibacter terrae TaxID=2586908 RepID=A0A5C8PIR9_9HYPH|nr:hypothetical protein [Vineibacter terrae]TXL73710.1 hypothetical protein FHP25_20095 [Vineibacter terrae]